MPADDRPTAKQQNYLRSLAQKTGTSFTPPRTKAQAHQEIDRLKALAASPRHERQTDRKAVRQGLATATSATRIRDEEIEGYGSTATWATGRVSR